MLKGNLLEILGLGLIVTAVMHLESSTTAWLNVGAGVLIAAIGTSLWNSASRLGMAANIVGVALMVVALIPLLRVHGFNIWIAGVAGVMAWGVGHQVAASESGGPWRLKDRPLY